MAIAKAWCYMMIQKVVWFLHRLLGTVYKMGKEDPRRVTHSIKYGAALTLASLTCLLEPLFQGIGKNATWTIMTVVVVLEFTAGSTLRKGLNRGAGTALAGLLAFLVEELAMNRPVPRAVFIASVVFVSGAAATYTRFFPNIKKHYDYGVMIFILTFNLILVSSYRVDKDVSKMARDRFYTIAIGVGICLSMSLFFFPNWSGDDLHNSTTIKLEELAKFVEYCVYQYFDDAEAKEVQEDCIHAKVLDSKSSDESLALHASWEPRHLPCFCSNPWLQYVKVGAVLRQFSHTVVSLHGCLRSEIQTPMSIRLLFKDPCTRVARGVSEVLTELSNSVKNRRQCSPEILSDHIHKALHDLNAAIKSQPRLFLGDKEATQTLQRTRNGQNGDQSARTPALMDWKSKRVASIKEGATGKMLRPQLSKIGIKSLEFSEALPFAAFTSLLVEAVARLDHVIDEVEELGRVAGFKEFKPDETASVINITTELPRVDI